MVQRMVEKIIEKQLMENTISREDINIYRYGYTLVCEVIINVIIAMLIGIIFKDIGDVVLFLLLYIPLRSFCGGWHADKVWKCTVYSNLVLLVMVVCDNYLIKYCNTVIFSSTIVICMVLLFLVAPIDTKSKPITVEEKIKFKKKIRLILTVHIILMVLMVLLELKSGIFVLSFTYVTQILIIVLGIENKRIKKS